MSYIKWVTRCQEFLKAVGWMTCGTLTPMFSDLGKGSRPTGTRQEAALPCSSARLSCGAQTSEAQDIIFHMGLMRLEALWELPRPG